MKRIITLSLATIAFVGVHAQNRSIILGGGTNKNYPSENNRDVVLGGARNNGFYPTYPNGYSNYADDARQAQVNQVNREYDAKIYSIRSNRYLSYREKDRSIRQLERDRQIRLQQINSACNNSNNGKHKGWYKNHNNRDRNWNNR